MDANRLTNPGGEVQHKDKKIFINPDFSDLQRPETFINHFEELKKHINTFPVHVFPDKMQAFINAARESLNFPVDFTAAGILFAASVTMGNNYKVRVKQGWIEKAVLYIVLVGKPGTYKTHPVNLVLKPIDKEDKESYERYKQEFSEYERIKALSEKERKQQGIDRLPQEPVWPQTIVNDYTPEALVKVHSFNEKGIGVYTDELAGWLNNFNRYHKGNEEQFWLSNFNGVPIRVTRKTSKSMFLENPFISVTGGVQPEVLMNISKGRIENGFLDRFLFFIPENLVREGWSETGLDPYYEEEWKNILSRLKEPPGSFIPEPIVLDFEPDARHELYNWQHRNVMMCNQPENEALNGVQAKIETYAPRLALIMEALSYACGESDCKAISLTSVKKALELVRYFQKTAAKVHSEVFYATAFDRLPSWKQTIYSRLAQEFTTSEGVTLAKQLGMSERTFKAFLNNKALFERIQQGKYQKLL